MATDVSFDYSKLRGRIKEKYKNEGNFAAALGIGRTSLSQRLNNMLEFSQKEMFDCAELLEFKPKEIVEYFFCPNSSETRTD